MCGRSYFEDTETSAAGQKAADTSRTTQKAQNAVPGGFKFTAKTSRKGQETSGSAADPAVAKRSRIDLTTLPQSNTQSNRPSQSIALSVPALPNAAASAYLPPYPSTNPSIVNSLPVHDSTPILTALPVILDAQLQHISAHCEAPEHEWVAEHLKALSDAVLQTLQQRMAAAAEEQRIQRIHEDSVKKLRTLVDGDVNEWLSSLQSYGTTNARALEKTPKSRDEIEQIRTVYSNWAIKGDAILGKLRHIKNALRDSADYTERLVTSVNAAELSAYPAAERDSRQLIRSIIAQAQAQA